MSAVIMDGKAVAGMIEESVASSVADMRHKPMLAIVTSGIDDASKVYVRNKVAAAKRCGINTVVCSLRDDMETQDYATVVERLDCWREVDGIIVQLPLPEHIDTNEVLSWISPKKDVDGLSDETAHTREAGEEGFYPCTPLGIMHLLDHYNIPVEGKHAVVVGRSNLVGKPVAKMLLERNATVTVCHSKTENLGEITRTADILIVAAGQAGLITAGMVKPGAAVIDVGINRVPERGRYGEATGKMVLVGDVNYNEVSEVAGYITPVPGGVGPMTVAMLMCNVAKAAENSKTIR